MTDEEKAREVADPILKGNDTVGSFADRTYHRTLKALRQARYETILEIAKTMDTFTAESLCKLAEKKYGGTKSPTHTGSELSDIENEN